MLVAQVGHEPSEGLIRIVQADTRNELLTQLMSDLGACPVQQAEEGGEETEETSHEEEVVLFEDE